jgi:hypothetical protein
MMRQMVFALCFMATSQLLAAQAGGVSGSWLFALTNGEYSAEYAADLQMNGEQVTGTWAGAKVEGTFRERQLALSFPFHPPEAEVSGQLTVTGRFDGDALVGDWSWNEYSGTFKAARKP